MDRRTDRRHCRRDGHDSESVRVLLGILVYNKQGRNKTELLSELRGEDGRGNEMRLIDAELLRSNIEDRIGQMTSEAVKGGLRVALKMVDDQPTQNTVRQPVVVDAEQIAEMVIERLEK